MKKLIIAAAALIVSLSAYGQGQFVFNNRIPPDINAKFTLGDANGPGLSGTDYTVQLLGGKAGTPVAQLTPIGTTDFRTGAAAGFVNPLSSVVVPGVPNGGSADVFLRIFKGVGTSGAQLAQFGPFTVTVAEAPTPTPNLPLGTSAFAVVVPEPATLALGALGLGALLMIRRRK